MNILALPIEIVGASNVKDIDGIQFSSCAFVQIEVDGDALLEREDFRGSSVYFEELKKSVLGSGQFLIFTCACGIADDGGWTRVDVEHKSGTVSWAFERAGQIRFVFALPQYTAAIQSCRAALEAVPTSFVIEPQHVVFPALD